MPDKLVFGGQAVMEGVMMRSPTKYAICVRRPDKTISTKIVQEHHRKSFFLDTPFIRGTFKLVETMSIGMNAIIYSANEASEEKEKLSKKELALTIVIGILLTIVLFYLLPLLFTKLMVKSSSNTIFNLIDGLLRLGIFIAYVLLISMMKDIQRLFQYHGAEHKVVNCFEAGKKLTVENVRRFPTSHPRCGTTFLLLVFAISIFVFSFIPSTNLLIRFAMRLLLLPVVAGISYELLRFSARHVKNRLVQIIIWPGLMMQKLTTREPDDSEIEIGIAALKAAAL